ncbi:MFS-type transporter SLC18B1-like isoform X1 [Choristoneura fumiferana]
MEPPSERSPLIDVRTTNGVNRNDGASTSVKPTGSDPDEMKACWDAVAMAGACGGRRPSSPSTGRRRAHSWSAVPPDNGSSEIRILRERLVRTQTRPRPEAMRQLSRRQQLTLASLALVDFMSFCSMSVMAPFFPGEASQKGLSNTVCGFVFSFYAVVIFITSPILGKFIPLVGAKFMFIAGMFIAGFCNVLFGSLVMIEDTTMFTVLCFVVRGAEALGASAYSTASYVFVVQTFPDAIGSVLGILETFVGLGMSVGPAIGGLLYSIGGFGLPFYTLGFIMCLTVPINFFLLSDCDGLVATTKSASVLCLFKIPSIIITGLVIVVVSNTWAFLDPTLEPHLRQFGLSTKQIGLVFLLFSSLYGIFSPLWGWVADRVHNHWCMMVWGLFLTTFGLLLLGPCPFIPGIPTDLWLDLVALSILSISVALTLLPTFQGVLASSIYEGGCPEALATYSAVAGVWSCCYSLGEVTGPVLGGALVQRYGFALGATICAGACFTMAVVALTFFTLRESSKWLSTESWSESLPSSDSTWTSSRFCTRSAPSRLDTSPLLTSCSRYSKNCYYPNATSTPIGLCIKHKSPNKSGSASITDTVVNILKFQYVTNVIVEIRKKSKPVNSNVRVPNSDLYQDYLKREEGDVIKKTLTSSCINENNNKTDELTTPDADTYCSYLENAIFGSPAVLEHLNLDNLLVKRHHHGLVSKTENPNAGMMRSEDIIRHNLEKVNFYEKNNQCSPGNTFNACGCKDEVTYARGTVAVSSTGACEV